MRDWLFSRQRYWGEPLPILHRADGSVIALPDDALPLLPPELDDYKPTPTGEPPLARAPRLGADRLIRLRARRRCAKPTPCRSGRDPCWYYLRFLDPHNDRAIVDPAKERYWMPVDLYVGGAEHAVLHLLYARFWHKVLYDIGIVSTKEPFRKLFNQGMILAYSYRDAAGKYYEPEKVTERDGRHFAGDMPVAAEDREDVEVALQRRQSRRHRRGIRRRCAAALRDVHGAARDDEAMADLGGARHAAFPRTRLAPGLRRRRPHQSAAGRRRTRSTARCVYSTRPFAR